MIANERLREAMRARNDYQEYGYIRALADYIAAEYPDYRSSNLIERMRDFLGRSRQVPMRWALLLIRIAEEAPGMSREEAHALVDTYFTQEG